MEPGPCDEGLRLRAMVNKIKAQGRMFQVHFIWIDRKLPGMLQAYFSICLVVSSPIHNAIAKRTLTKSTPELVEYLPG